MNAIRVDELVGAVQFDRLASARAASDNVSLKDFLMVAKSFDRQEREEQHDERAAWRSYRENRSSAFNDLVRGAAQQEGRGPQRGEHIGRGDG
ncbi:hypothetical protein AAFO90_21145 [Phaeobacter sp. CAU 1743]|uniref:hypothetical protein n=1 Tax=Phaeobacter sp. CAU 1743 TaxID=3140367 RepID=UPI00325B093E